MYVAVRLCGTTLQAHRALKSRSEDGNQKQPREMALATCDACTEQMRATCYYPTIHPWHTTRAGTRKKWDRAERVRCETQAQPCCRFSD